MIELKSAPNGLKGDLKVPGDKSISHRALMLGAISQGTTTIENFLTGEDCLSTLNAFKALGVDIQIDGSNVKIEGKGFAGLKNPNQVLDMGNSGTTTRLLMGILAGQAYDVELFGDESLSKRPMIRVSKPLEKFGVKRN